MKHFDIRIYGKVQGVWFRKSTQLKAQKLGLTGFVKNEPDGSVYAEAEGSEAMVDQFCKWCWEGSPLSKVTTVQIKEGSLKGFQGFEIRR